MAGIRISGMASGLPPNIVDQLMDAERIPVKEMELKKGKVDEKLKLVTEFEGKVNDITKNLGELTSSGGFVDKKFTSSDVNVLDGQVDPKLAVPGNYSLEVMQLAENPAAISNGFPDKDKTQLGVGYIKFDTPKGEKEVYLNSKNNTLDGVARQINDSDVGMKAQVIEDRKDKKHPFKLIVSGLATGDDKQVTFPKIYLLDGDQDMFFDQSRKAINAKVKVDGFEVEIPENKSTTLIPGVTLDIKSAAPGKVIHMTVKENLEVIGGKVKSFVDAYNAALDFVQKQGKLTVGDNKKSQLGPLGGDGMLRSVESDLRSVILAPQDKVGSPIKRISELGVEFNRNGTLSFSQDKFNKVLSENPGGVAAFFRGDGFNTGYIASVKKAVFNLTNTEYGVIANRKKGLNSNITQINDRIDAKQRQLEKKEDGLRRKFSDLESKMSDLNAQGAKFAAMNRG